MRLSDRGVWGHAPQKNFLISDLMIMRTFLVQFLAQELDDDLLPNLVIVFEAFKPSQSLKAWLCFALQRLQSSGGKKEKF